MPGGNARSKAGGDPFSEPVHRLAQPCTDFLVRGTREHPVEEGCPPLVTYLEKDEMDTLLTAPDRGPPQGYRDHRALLLFMYNTGARADKVAHVRIVDLALGLTPRCDTS